MKKIILIRHGESQANVQKELFRYSDTIKITEKGKQQADELVEILEKPDRIIVSKFIRTTETAVPLIKYLEKENHRHDVHLWLDTHEFDSVCLEKHHTTMKEHQEFIDAVKTYWGKADPFYRDSEHVENFKEFIERVDGVYKKLIKIPDGINYVFTHGWFIKLFLLMGNKFSNFELRKSEPNIFKEIMDSFLEFDKEFKTKNAGQYDVTELVEK